MADEMFCVSKGYGYQVALFPGSPPPYNFIVVRGERLRTRLGTR